MSRPWMKRIQFPNSPGPSKRFAWETAGVLWPPCAQTDPDQKRFGGVMTGFVLQPLLPNPPAYGAILLLAVAFCW